MLARRVCSQRPWRGAALACYPTTSRIRSTSWSGRKLSQRAASANVPARYFHSPRFDTFGSGHRTAKRCVISGSRLLPSPARLYSTPRGIRESDRGNPPKRFPSRRWEQRRPVNMPIFSRTRTTTSTRTMRVPPRGPTSATRPSRIVRISLRRTPLQIPKTETGE